MMLADAPTFSSFAVDDLDAARSFYGETLGLNVEDGPMGVLSLQLAGDRATLVYPKPDFTPATYTVLNFQVDDVETAVDELSSRGVEFERYDDSFKQDERGIARAGGPAIAWFKDPAGNILAVLAN
jgi:catechol 2,3-dioxygenase-like lactoylglutathione lyase family enzyme